MHLSPTRHDIKQNGIANNPKALVALERNRASTGTMWAGKRQKERDIEPSGSMCVVTKK